MASIPQSGCGYINQISTADPLSSLDYATVITYRRAAADIQIKGDFDYKGEKNHENTKTEF